MTPEEIAELRARMDILIGSKRWLTAFAAGMGKTRESVTYWFNGKQPPAEFTVVLEFLEITPVKKWPKRWSKLSAIKIRAAKKSK